MAHYAFIDDAGIVTEVIVGHDEGHGVDWEAYYAAVRGQVCKRTSYHTRDGVHALGGTPYRQNFAGIGYRFDPTVGPDGAFLPPEVP
jgi:hypothetical protein